MHYRQTPNTIHHTPYTIPAARGHQCIHTSGVWSRAPHPWPRRCSSSSTPGNLRTSVWCCACVCTYVCVYVRVCVCLSTCLCEILYVYVPGNENIYLLKHHTHNTGTYTYIHTIHHTLPVVDDAPLSGEMDLSFDSRHLSGSDGSDEAATLDTEQLLVTP